MSQTIDGVFRDFKTAGIPASGDHEPRKPEIRALLKQIQNSGGMSVTRNTASALLGVTPPTENYMGVVLDDPDATKNGYYSRVAGEWVRERGFPETAARLVGVAGTGNAPTASTAPGVDPGQAVMLFFTPRYRNTGAMTLSINGAAAKPLLTFDGQPMETDFLKADATVPVYDNGTEYRLLWDHRWEVLAAQTRTDRDAAIEARGGAELAQGASEAAQGLSEDARDLSERYRDQAGVLRDQSAAAAESADVDAWEDTKAIANANFASYPTGAVIGVFADETKGGSTVVYRKVGALLVEKRDADARTRAVVPTVKTPFSTPGYIPALGDALDYLPRSIKGFSGVVGDGATDQTTKLVAALASGAKNFQFPPDAGDYILDGSIVMPSGVRVAFQKGARIRQMRQTAPVFDCLGADDIEMESVSVIANVVRSQVPGNWRGDGANAQACAVWLNGSRNKIKGLKSRGFKVGVFATAWNPMTNTNDLSPELNEIEGLDFEDGDFGVLFKRQKHLKIAGTRARNVSMTPGTGNPPHAIYGTGGKTDRSADVLIVDTQVSDCTATAIQVKWTDGLYIGDLITKDSDVMQITDCTDFVVNGVLGIDAMDRTNVGGGTFNCGQQDAFIDTISKGGLISNVLLKLAPGVVRACGFIADDLTVRNLIIEQRLAANASGSPVLSLGGRDQDIEGDIRPLTAFYNLAAQVRTVTGPTTTGEPSTLRPSDNISVRLKSRGSYNGLRVEANCTNSRIIFDPEEVTMMVGGTHLVNANASTGTKLKRSDREILAPKPSSTFEVPNAASATRSLIRPDASNYSVAAPSGSSLTQTPDGTVLEIIVENTTAGALGGVTWASAYVFKTAFASPAAGKAVSYRFRFNGTNWVEI